MTFPSRSYCVHGYTRRMSPSSSLMATGHVSAEVSATEKWSPAL